MVFDEDNGSQGGRIDHGVVGDAIPPIVIRRMGIGEIIPVEEHLLAKGEGLCVGCMPKKAIMFIHLFHNYDSYYYAITDVAPEYEIQRKTHNHV